MKQDSRNIPTQTSDFVITIHRVQNNCSMFNKQLSRRATYENWQVWKTHTASLEP